MSSGEARAALAAPGPLASTAYGELALHLLSLWCPFAADEDPDERQGHYFQSAMVARPGYGDTPAEAAARLAAGGEPGY